jgi:hypothetical protein
MSMGKPKMSKNASVTKAKKKGLAFGGRKAAPFTKRGGRKANSTHDAHGRPKKISPKPRKTR